MCVELFQSQLPVPLLVKPLLLDQTFLLTVLLAQTKDLTDLFVEFFFKRFFLKMQITCVVEVSGIDTVMALIHSLALLSPWCVSQNTTSPILPEHGKKA